MIPQLTFVATTVLIGWVALWPARGSLGRTGYHIAAFPTGLLGWGFVATVAIALRHAYTWSLTIVALALFCAGVALLARLAARGDAHAPTHAPWWSFAITLTLFGIATAVFAKWGITVVTHDGWAQYEMYSWLLFDSGKASAIMIGQRMLIPIAFHAAFHLFGGEFSGFIYPLLSLQVATLVGISAYRATRPAHRAAAVAVAVTVVVAMVTQVTYLFMSIYVHSHMPTVIYLMLCGYALWRSQEHLSSAEEDHGASERARLSLAWLLVAGLSLAGIWLTRPDGPAYAMGAVLLLAAILLTKRARQRDVYLFFVPMLALSATYTFSTVINRGKWWTTDKLDAMQLVKFLILYTIIWVALTVIPLQRFRWLALDRSFTSLVLAVEAVALVWAFRRIGEDAVLTVQNMVTNLLQQGGWRFFWPFMGAMVAVSLLFYIRDKRDPFTSTALFYVSQFLVIALFVHGFTHPGRLGWGDSLNRVAFHAVPLLYWYLGLYVGGLVQAIGSPLAKREL